MQTIPKKLSFPTPFYNIFTFLLWICFCVTFNHCGSPHPKSYQEERKHYLKGVGLPILVSIQPRHNKDKKELQLFIKTENLTNINISKFQILFFASDGNRQLLIPEESKTPELICSIQKKIQPNSIYKCLVGPYVFTQLWNSIQVQSISFTTEDQVRHVIDEEDLNDVILWL